MAPNMNASKSTSNSNSTAADTNASSETTSEEGPEGSDKPPHPRSQSSLKTFEAFAKQNTTINTKDGHKANTPSPTTPTAHSTLTSRSSTTTTISAATMVPAMVNGHGKGNQHEQHHIPLPPPEAHSYEKSPGHTHSSLEKLSGPNPAPLANAMTKSNKSTTSSGPVSISSQPPSSASASSSDIAYDDGSWSLPSTRPPSQAPSRAPSMSAGTSGGKVKQPQLLNVPPVAASKSTASSVVSTGKSTEPSKPKSRSNSVHSVDADKHSQRSTGSRSSRKSDSDNGRGGGGVDGKSDAGGSAVSLSQKYGVCQKVAIGKGATSVVRLAHKWDRTEEKLYAVKEFRKRRKNETEKEYIKKLTAEFCISSTLHHPNIVETVDLVQDENQHWCEVMEFCPGGDLYAAIKRGGMSGSEVECCFKQILRGVGYLHSQGVAHRDIKPENLFFDTKGHLKIGDYGASTVYRLPWEATIHMSTGLCGSEPYIAPEQFLGKPYDARLVDIWACGIVYYCLHFQELPWRAAQASDQLYHAYATACAAAPFTAASPATTTFPTTVNNLSPRACRPLIRRMLEPDPKSRIRIDDILGSEEKEKKPGDEWVKGIEVCHEVKSPSHVHVHARALAQALEK
ncbi:hypothetical protein ONZ45_g15441 [Pleurotus djamor]|nr:hypothetical protein ONZ45_g15441 [Pleurotus djamor]